MMNNENQELVRLIVDKVLENLKKEGIIEKKENIPGVKSEKKKLLAPAEISARHIHISEEHLEKLFGRGYKLNKLKDLSQPGQFAARETIRIIGKKRVLDSVRILGPCRSRTQVELSISDCYYIGVEPVIRLSGDISGTPGILIMGPEGYVELQEGVIVAKRHLHIEDDLAEIWGLENNSIVSFRVSGVRELLFSNVIVRRGPGHKLALHLDTDEGNAAGLKSGTLVELIR